MMFYTYLDYNSFRYSFCLYVDHELLENVLSDRKLMYFGSSKDSDT
jgi:hypothetical protein